MSVQGARGGLPLDAEELYNEQETRRRKRIYMDIVKGSV